MSAGAGQDGEAHAPDGEQLKPKQQHSGADPLSWADEAHKMAQWQKQVDFGKNTLGYQTYLKRVPKHKRQRADPTTPEISKDMSKRKFDGQVRAWKRMLHKYDILAHEELLNPQAGVASSKKRDHTGTLKEDSTEPGEELRGKENDAGVNPASARGSDGSTRSKGSELAVRNAVAGDRQGKARGDERVRVERGGMDEGRRKQGGGKGTKGGASDGVRGKERRQLVAQTGAAVEAIGGAAPADPWGGDRRAAKRAPQSRWEQMQEDSRDAWDEDIQL